VFRGHSHRALRTGTPGDAGARGRPGSAGIQYRSVLRRHRPSAGPASGAAAPADARPPGVAPGRAGSSPCPRHPMTQSSSNTGMRPFLVIWFGQLISLIGSGLTSFALGVWTYQRTGSVTRFALITFFAALPGIVLAPLAGALADRWDKRRAMILA